MNLRMVYKIFSVCLLALSMGACTAWQNIPRSIGAATSPSPTPTPKPEAYIAYLYEGDLWVIQRNGANQRVVAAAPEGETIQDFVWAPDGSRIYFSIGLQIFEVILQTGNVASAGGLTASPGVSIDRLEMGRDGRTIVVQALDAYESPRLFAVAIGGNDSRELTVDEYGAIIGHRPPVIRNIGEMSVSPDGRRVLFKDIVETGEELFIADTETGARMKVSNLYDLSGFEESVESEGGRRLIEAAWSPDGRCVIFNPMQSCSETGLCYGRLFLVDAWQGAQLQLSVEMMVNLPGEWAGAWAVEPAGERVRDNKLLVYDDGSKIVVADTKGNPKALAEGHHPKWQPMP